VTRVGGDGMHRLQQLAEPAFIRFLFVGVLNTVFGYGMFYLLLWVGLVPEVGLFCTTVAGVLFNFMTTSRLVFKQRGAEFFLPFIAVYVFVYLINAGALRLLINASVTAAQAQAFLLVPIVVMTYVLLKRFVYVARSQ
jgi:putative flippase GtrA